MIVFSIGFPFTILIVFFMHRGSELWRIIGSIQAGVLMALALVGVNYVSARKSGRARDERS